MPVAVQTAPAKRRLKKKIMPRPKLPITKECRIDVRMHPAVRKALERIAYREGRTMSQLCERFLRQAVLRDMQQHEEDTAEIEALP